jgi:hypothetical protein
VISLPIDVCFNPSLTLPGAHDPHRSTLQFMSSLVSILYTGNQEQIGPPGAVVLHTLRYVDPQILFLGFIPFAICKTVPSYYRVPSGV